MSGGERSREELCYNGWNSHEYPSGRGRDNDEQRRNGAKGRGGCMCMYVCVFVKEIHTRIHGYRNGQIS